MSSSSAARSWSARPRSRTQLRPPAIFWSSWKSSWSSRAATRQRIDGVEVLGPAPSTQLKVEAAAYRGKDERPAGDLGASGSPKKKSARATSSACARKERGTAARRGFQLFEVTNRGTSLQTGPAQRRTTWRSSCRSCATPTNKKRAQVNEREAALARAPRPRGGAGTRRRWRSRHAFRARKLQQRHYRRGGAGEALHVRRRHRPRLPPAAAGAEVADEKRAADCATSSTAISEINLTAIEEYKELLSGTASSSPRRPI